MTNSRPDQTVFALKGQTGGGIGAISSLTVSSILVESSEIGLGNNQYISTIGGQLVFFDGTTLEPISQLSSLSTIEDWSFYPAISTVNLGNENLLGGNVIAGTQVSTNVGFISSLYTQEQQGGTGFISSLSATTLNATSTVTNNAVVNETLTTSTINANGGSYSTLTATSTITDTLLCNGGLVTSSLQANDVSTSSLSADTISVSSIVANDISTITLTAISTIHAISSISSASITADALLSISSINGQPISFYEPGGVSTVSTFQQLGTSSLTTSTINGFVPDSVANWAQYGANNQINLQNNTIYSGGGSADDVNLVGERFVKATGESIYVNADNGISLINPSLIQLSTTNGSRGQIDIIANEGQVLSGKITMTAEGTEILGLQYGGVIEITANTGGGFIPSPALTSAIRLNAASILEYSGATNSIGSAAGYGFYHGDLGINITAGVPPLVPNDPLTVYLFGTNGVLVYSPMYVLGPIRPYSDLTNNPVDLYIESYSNLITKGYVQLRGVSTQTFEGGDTAILGVNRVQFSTVGGALENVSSINGQPLSFYEPGGVSTLSSFTELFTSSLAASTIQVLDISASAIQNLSSINGQSIAEFQNPSSISTVENWAEFPAISSIHFSTGVAQIIVPSGGSALGLWTNFGVQIRDASGIGYEDLVCNGVTALGPVTVSSLNIDNRYFFDTATVPSTIVLNNFPPGSGQANLVAGNATFPSISTGFIQGTGTDMFGISGFNDGLNIKASSIALTSTPLVVFTGNLNGSTCSFFQANIRDVVASTVTTSTLNVNTIPTATFSTLRFAQQAAYGLSSLVGLSTAGTTSGTSTIMTINTDLSIGTNDLFCGQVRIFAGSNINTAEIAMTGPDGYFQTIDRANADITLRTRSGLNSAISTGYFLDTFHNKPFFSTINQSTAMMAYFPSTNASTIGFSTLSVIPPNVAYGSWYSSTSQTVAGANTLTPLTYNSEAMNIGGFSFAGSTITVPVAGNYKITHSIQFDTASGGANNVYFWPKKNGTDIPQTNSIVTVVNNGETLGTIEVFTNAAAGDQFAVCINAPADANMTAAALNPAVGPRVPSIITNIQKL